MAPPPLATVVWRRPAYCHAPGDRPVELAKLAASDGADRWNDPGEPTVYLASDAAVALAELARHLPSDAGARRLLRLRLAPLELVDLRDPGSLAALGVAGPAALLDQDVARAIARRIRPRGGAGLVVPSMAFLDDPRRANLVLFPEQLTDGLERAVSSWLEAGTVTLRR